MKLLDTDIKNWINEIDLDLLNMGHMLNCVLGQLYGSYEIGRLHFELDARDVISHGFMPDYTKSISGSHRLTQIWKYEINARRKAIAAKSPTGSKATR